MSDLFGRNDPPDEEPEDTVDLYIESTDDTVENAVPTTQEHSGNDDGIWYHEMTDDQKHDYGFFTPPPEMLQDEDQDNDD